MKMTLALFELCYHMIVAAHKKIDIWCRI